MCGDSMGRIGWRGETSRKIYRLKEPTTGELHLVNESDGVTLAKFNPTTIEDAGGVKLASHGDRHGYGQPDAIPDNALRYRQLKAVFASGTSVTVSAGGTYTIPEGVWYVFCEGASNTRIEVYDDVNGAWRTVIPAGSNGLVISDGSNVRAYNAGTADETIVLREIT